MTLTGSHEAPPEQGARLLPALLRLIAARPAAALQRGARLPLRRGTAHAARAAAPPSPATQATLTF